jgi:sensor histidine kinase YesM
VAIGWPIGVIAISGDVSVLVGVSPLHWLSMLAITVLTSTLVYLYFELRNREFQAEARAADARLRLLHGQMEPHFLFNTLANVISLIDADPPRARAVLEEFTDYLRASLGGMRSGQSTLGAELELATHFLHLMQARMSERLRFELDSEPALRGAALPALLLQPLVENAVKHGLEPKLEGGSVRVSAARVATGGRPALRICVVDDGVGLDAPARRGRAPQAAACEGAGIALANLRERLQALYGGAAQLTLSPRTDGPGAEACLVVPLVFPQSSEATAACPASR